MTLDRLPSVIANTRFNAAGLAETKEGLLVPAYVASQLGFSTIGKVQLNALHDRLREEAGVLPLCPFTACAEYLDFSRLGAAHTIDDVLGFWDEFNRLLGPVNYDELMPRSKFMIAILDGGHAVDDGVATEIGFYAGRYQGEKPILGIRSDFRLAENPAAPINPAIRYFLDQGPFNGQFFHGAEAYDRAVDAAKDLAARIRASE